MVEPFLFHPPLTHFPIAFVFLEAFLVALWIWRKEELYEKFAFLILKMTACVAPFVMLAGLKDANGIPLMARTHAFVAILLVLSVLARLFLRWKQGSALWTGKYRTLYLAWLFLGLALVVLVGYFGGILADA